MTTPETSTAEFFEAKYSQSPDPWGFAINPYELGRYDAIMNAISHRRYRSAIELGCSIGVLTERLAALSGDIVAIDFSASAVTQASSRCAHLPGIHIACASVSDRPHFSGFELIVFSEIGYYFSLTELQTLSSRMVDSMDQGAVLLAAHWLGHSSDHRIGGDAVHDVLSANPQLALEYAERHSAFRIDRWIRI